MASGEREFVLNTPDRLGNPVILGAETLRRMGYKIQLSPRGFGANGEALGGYRGIGVLDNDERAKKAVSAILEDPNFAKLANLETFGIGAFAVEGEDCEYTVDLPEVSDEKTKTKLIAFGHFRFARKAEETYFLLLDRDPKTASRYWDISKRWSKKGREVLNGLRPIDINELRGLVEQYTYRAVQSLN